MHISLHTFFPDTAEASSLAKYEKIRSNLKVGVARGKGGADGKIGCVCVEALLVLELIMLLMLT